MEEELSLDERVIIDIFTQLMDAFNGDITFDLNKEATYHLYKEKGYWYFHAPNIRHKYGFKKLYDLCMFAFQNFSLKDDVADYCINIFESLCYAEKIKRKAEEELEKIKNKGRNK